MTSNETGYKNFLKNQSPSNAALSVSNILAHNTPFTGPEDDYYQDWNILNAADKETSENLITDALFAEIAEVDHVVWEGEFETVGVVFTGGETLPDKCRKRRPQT